MVYVFFGKERLSSGSLLVADSPYFIGLFLCESEMTNEPFTGRYYRAGGRFVCADRPPVGTLVTTDYPIGEAFTRFFGRDQAPDVSGSGIAIDTNNVRGNGVAKAFVRKIEFLQQPHRVRLCLAVPSGRHQQRHVEGVWGAERAMNGALPRSRPLAEHRIMLQMFGLEPGTSQA